MRKLWYAGAVLAGGVFLVGAAPAQADLLPGTDTAQTQADQSLTDLLGQSNGMSMDNPLRYSSLNESPLARNPVVQFKAGQNTPDLNPALPGESAAEHRPELPAADVVGGVIRRTNGVRPMRDRPVRQRPTQGGLPVQELPVRQLPVFGNAGLPLLGGLLMPDGRSAAAVAGRPTVRQAEMFDGGVPLLGGLGGLLPANESPRTLPADGDPADATGLPGGGMAILPAAGATPTATPSATPTAIPSAAPSFARPAADEPAQAKPAKPAKPAAKPAKPAKPQPAATPDDPRLHEEPIDDEASQRRPFSSDGRPVAGIDEEYK